ncbi:MAG: hypothetical protein EXX96DRAFT_62092 [Benjaminiella poitrasii]|nr:MAG: hypothetical protein EXX96DRAFT_62092 [Benjaminiella poitrasii]
MNTDVAVSGAFNFSGTDNGLVTMTDTVRLSMERFKFHLDLFLTSFNGQKYELQNVESEFLCLHESGSFKIYSSSIQLWSGARKFRYGGRWKPIQHSQYTTICVITEFNSCQTCVYCFQKLLHPVDIRHKNSQQMLMTNKGSFIRINPQCVSVRSAMATHSRDTVSATAIGLSGSGNSYLWGNFPSIRTSTDRSQEESIHNGC